MLSSWRGVRDDMTTDDEADEAKQEHVYDWYDFMNAETNMSRLSRLTQSARKSFADEMTAKKAKEDAMREEANKAKKKRPETARPALPRGKHVPIAPVGSVASCMYPPPGTPFAMGDRERLSRRQLGVHPWVANTALRQKEERRRARGARDGAREAMIRDSHCKEAEALDQVEASRSRALREHHELTKGLQRVVESFGADAGRERANLETSSFEHCAAVPPHMNSHWQTIQGGHKDPPPRDHTHKLYNYRKDFPEQYTRPVPEPMNHRVTMFVRPSWGGAR
jgi:hypothetical protein